MILPEGILEYFELTNVTQSPGGLNIYLEEKNLPPLGYEKSGLGSKGSYRKQPYRIFLSVAIRWRCALNGADGK